MQVDDLGEDVVKRAQARLHRVQGQLRAIDRMLDEGAECQQVLRQIAAASTALRKLGVQVAVDGLQHCVRDPDSDADLEAFRRAFLELS